MERAATTKSDLREYRFLDISPAFPEAARPEINHNSRDLHKPVYHLPLI